MTVLKHVHFLVLEPRETDENVLKFTNKLVLKFHFLLLGALSLYCPGNELCIASGCSCCMEGSCIASVWSIEEH